MQTPPLVAGLLLAEEPPRSPWARRLCVQALASEIVLAAGRADADARARAGHALAAGGPLLVRGLADALAFDRRFEMPVVRGVADALIRGADTATDEEITAAILPLTRAAVACVVAQFSVPA